MSLLDIKLIENEVRNSSLQETSSTNDKVKKESVEDIDNIKIEDPQQTEVKDKKVDLLVTNPNSDIDIIEDSLKENDYKTDELIAETIYNIDKVLYDAISMIESIEISAINKQYMIMQESAIDSEKYLTDIDTLIEASGSNILTIIIQKIKEFISKAKKFLSDLGINISIGLVDYDKFISENENSLKKISSEIGNKVVIADYIKYNEDNVLGEVDFKKLHSLIYNYIKDTKDKSEMKKEIESIRNKYDSDTDFYNDIYAHILGEAIGKSDSKVELTDKSAAFESFSLSFIKKDKSITMDLETTTKMIDKLKNAKIKTSKLIANMKNSAVDPDFERLTKDVESAMLKSEEEDKTTKYTYYKLRFGALCAIQTACNDIYRTKCIYIKKYYREIYNALKKLYKEGHSTMDESIDCNSILKEYPALILQS